MFGRSKIPTLKVPKQSADEAKAAVEAPPPPADAASPPRLPAGAKTAGASKKKDRSDEFYELKSRVHRKLVETLDLAEIGKRNSAEIKDEVRQVIAKIGRAHV